MIATTQYTISDSTDSNLNKLVVTIYPNTIGLLDISNGDRDEIELCGSEVTDLIEILSRSKDDV